LFFQTDAKALRREQIHFLGTSKIMVVEIKVEDPNMSQGLILRLPSVTRESTFRVKMLLVLYVILLREAILWTLCCQYIKGKRVFPGLDSYAQNRDLKTGISQFTFGLPSSRHGRFP